MSTNFVAYKTQENENKECYDELFTFNDLKEYLRNSQDTAVG